jgi:hypothetical protein
METDGYELTLMANVVSAPYFFVFLRLLMSAAAGL